MEVGGPEAISVTILTKHPGVLDPGFTNSRDSGDSGKERFGLETGTRFRDPF